MKPRAPSAAGPVLAAIVTLLPFTRKAFNVDDPLFLWTARQISERPFHFFDFRVNWYGWDMPMSEVMQNPPGVSYYLALVGSLFGWDESTLHRALLVPAALVAWGLFALAREFDADPWFAALATIATPAFVVCGSNVMSDMSMLAGWTWALVWWVRGIRSERPHILWAAAVIGGLALLTKYFAVSVVGLFVVYAWSSGRIRWTRWLGPALLPLLILAAYETWTFFSYGRPLFVSAAGYTTARPPSQFVSQALSGLSFAGGAALIAACVSFTLWSRREVLRILMIAVVLVAVAIAMGSLSGADLRDASGLRWERAAQLLVFVFSGVSVLALAWVDARRTRDAASRLLLFWVLGTLVFACFVNWSINLRALLPIVPAVALLAARGVRRESIRGFRKWVPLVPAISIAMLVGLADFRWAEGARTAPRVVEERFAGQPGEVWFEGHWGFQWYMEERGYRPVDFKRPLLRRGDVLVLPSNNTNVRGMNPSMIRPLPEIRVPVDAALATMRVEDAAGAYSHIGAPLPFALSSTDSEVYFVVSVN